MHDPVLSFRAAILSALGHAPEVIEPGHLHRFATSDKRGDDAGWCRLFTDMRAGVYGCHRAGLKQTWRADFDSLSPAHALRVDQAHRIALATAERERAQRELWAENGRRIAALWEHCVPLVPGDPVTLYLKGRGFADVWPLPACLRLHRSLPCWEGNEKIGTFPAMVAPLMTLDGQIVALHRTYLTANGRKADIHHPKKLTGTAGTAAGACIPLHEPYRGVLGIAEGIETAMAAWLASCVPTVAAYCANNLAAWQWPCTVRRLVIFGDNDIAGREAASDLQARALASGLGCEVLIPTDSGADWCDVWAQRQAGPKEGAVA